MLGDAGVRELVVVGGVGLDMAPLQRMEADRDGESADRAGREGADALVHQGGRADQDAVPHLQIEVLVLVSEIVLEPLPPAVAELQARGGLASLVGDARDDAGPGHTLLRRGRGRRERSSRVTILHLE